MYSYTRLQLLQIKSKKALWFSSASKGKINILLFSHAKGLTSGQSTIQRIQPKSKISKMKNENGIPPIFKTEKWKMKCLTQGFSKMKYSKNQKVNLWSYSKINDWSAEFNVWTVYTFNDWFLKTSKIDFWRRQRLIFWTFDFFHFWKMRLLYLYLNSNNSKMKNEELQK